jgi:TonB-linked SusC/RagA family outer membrane protein
MKKIVQDHFPKGKWGKMLSLTRLALVAMACSVGALTAAPAVSSASQQATQSARRSVTGVVTDQNGDPVIGANVTVEGVIGVGTTTNARGQYTINVARGATLEFSFVGMATRTVQVANQTTIDVRLQEESLVTGDVIVTASVNRPRESFTGAARVISGEELRQASAGSVVTALRNLDPTFYVAENNLMGSDPNTLPVVTMRGATSMPMMGGTTSAGMEITNVDQAREYSNQANLPLLLIDGFISDFSRLSDIDENLIESITLMKDAASTAMYGTRASNGVIDVVTKKPQKGELRVTYNGGARLQAPDLSSYNLMNAAEKLEYERLAGLYETTGSTTWYEYLSYQNLYRMKLIDVMRGVDTYWMKYPLRVSLGHNHSLMVDGGEDDFQYSANIYYSTAPGVMKGSKRDNFRGAMKFIYNKNKFRFMNELEVATTTGTNSPYGSEGAFADYSRKNPYYTPYNADGSLKDKLHDYEWKERQEITDQWKNHNDNNPLYDASLPQRHTSSSLDVTDRFNFEWRIIPELVVRGQASVTTTHGRSDDYWSKDMLRFSNVPADKASYKGQYNLNMNTRNRFDTRLAVQYTKIFAEKHLFDLALTGEMYQTRNENYYFTAYGITNPTDVFFGSAKHWLNHNDAGQPNGNDQTTRNAGTSLSGTYVYDERYFANWMVKIEGSSLFGDNNTYAPNWMAGVGWNLHNEEFFDMDWVEYARLKANYGSTGSQNFQPSQSKILFQSSEDLYDQWGSSFITGLGNRDLKWEKTYALNLGTDWSLFENRLGFEFNWYDRRTHDLITSVALPSASGFTTYAANIGKAQNVGWDMILRGAVIRDYDRDITWNVTVNAAHNKNMLLELGNGLSEMNKEFLNRMTGGSLPATQYIEGQERDMMYVKKSIGIDPMSGREVFLDSKGNQTFDWNAAELVKVGSPSPKIYGNLNTDVSWKGWRLMLSFRYEMGATVYMSELVQKVEGDNPWENMDRRALQSRWNSYGQRAQFKSVREYGETTKATTRFVADHDWLQLSSVNLTYEVPTSWSQRNLGISYLKVQGSMGESLYFSTVRRERGINYPFARSFNLSLNARF